jgi:hypothetical protein
MENIRFNKPYVRYLIVSFCIPLHVTINFALFNYVSLTNFTFSQDAENNPVCKNQSPPKCDRRTGTSYGRKDVSRSRRTTFVGPSAHNGISWLFYVVLGIAD